MPRLRSIWLLFLVFGAAAGLRADENKLPLHVARLELFDGRVLKDVTVTAYDVANYALLVVANGNPMVIPIRLVRRPWADWLRADAPHRNDPPVTTVAIVDNAKADEALAEGHKQAAIMRARVFYRYEFTAGSPSSSVTAVIIEADEPAAIDGWPGRCRTQGKVHVEYVEGPDASARNADSNFEVITELTPEKALKVIDFTRKS